MGAEAMADVKWNQKSECLSPVDAIREVNLSEELIEDKKLLLAYAVESSNDAIITKTTDNIITSWNQGAERLYGFSASEVIGKPISFLNPTGHTDEMPKISERIKRKEKKSPYYETVRKRKDGQIIYVSASLSAIKDKHGQIIGA